MGSVDGQGALIAGKYRLERELARGASGVVFESTHMITGRVVALKLCDPERGWGPKQRERWLREARAASRVSHPNLLPIEDVLELEGGRAALVMERLVGEPLRARIGAGPLAEGEVRALFLPVIDALLLAHEAGIVHRDLKPDNLFVVASPRRLVVLDFGVAKLSSDTELGLTSTGATVGTPFYMAPEQLFGEEDVDARADVWSLGVVLFECLTGRRPVDAANLGQLLKKISAGSIERLAGSSVSPSLASIVDRMLDVDRNSRASLSDLHASLSSLSSLSSLAPASPPSPASSPPSPPSPSSSSSSSSSSSPSSPPLAPAVSPDGAPAAVSAASMPPPALAASPAVEPRGRAWPAFAALGAGALLAATFLMRSPAPPPSAAPTAQALATQVGSVMPAEPVVPGGPAGPAATGVGSAVAVVAALSASGEPVRRAASAAPRWVTAATGAPGAAPAVLVTASANGARHAEPPRPRIVETAPF